MWWVLLSSLFYLAVPGIWSWQLVKKGPKQAPRLVLHVLATAALFFQYISLTDFLFDGPYLSLSIGIILSTITALTVTILLVHNTRQRNEFLLVMASPIAAIMTLLPQIGLDESELIALHWGVGFHVIFALLALALLLISILQGLIVRQQTKWLRQHPPKKRLLILPPLQQMEQIQIHFFHLGFVVLSLSMVQGLFFAGQVLQPGITSKAIVTLVAWLILGTIWVGHKVKGWRGTVLNRWLAIGFLLVGLAYITSKLTLG